MQASVTSQQGKGGGKHRIGERVWTRFSAYLFGAWHWRAQPTGTDGMGSGGRFVGNACFTSLLQCVSSCVL